MTTDKVQERVSRGAALLDQRYPGWFTKIDLAHLDMSTNCLCVLGQVTGSYAASTGELCPGTADWHGFMAAVHEASEESYDRAYAALDREWTQVILARRAEAEGAPVVAWTHRAATSPTYEEMGASADVADALRASDVVEAHARAVLVRELAKRLDKEMTGR